MKKLVRMSAAALTLMMAAHSAHAQSGSCGTNCSWNLNTSSGVLTISGSGPMTNYLGGTSGYGPWYASRSSIKSVVISGVTSIGESAFYSCSNLTQVTIGNSVKSIGDAAFYYCKLTSVVIPSGVTSIGKNAFQSNSTLTSITIPSSVTSIGTAAFYDCGFTSLPIIPNSITSIGNTVFSECRSLTSVTIPSHITSLEGNAFSYCRNLASVTIPNSVNSIGVNAFAYCRNLTSVNIPSSVTSIGNAAFRSCSTLTSITIPSSVTSIGNTNTFSQCTSLTKIICHMPTPASINANFFDNVPRNIPIYVPSGSVDAYRAAPVWQEFQITPIPEVTFNSQGGSAVPPQILAPDANAKAVKPADPAKSGGYSFCGWYTSTSYAAEWNFNNVVTGHITLYAKWMLDKITVTYKCVGVGCNPDFGNKPVEVPRYP